TGTALRRCSHTTTRGGSRWPPHRRARRDETPCGMQTTVASPTRRTPMSQARPITRRTAAPGAAAAAAASPRRGPALFVIATPQLMVVLEATIVNVGLRPIRGGFSFSGSGLEWVVNAYGLPFGGLMLRAGRAGDLFARRGVFIAGCCCSRRRRWPGG